MFCSFASYFRFSIHLCTSSEGNLDCAMLCIFVRNDSHSPARCSTQTTTAVAWDDGEKVITRKFYLRDSNYAWNLFLRCCLLLLRRRCCLCLFNLFVVIGMMRCSAERRMKNGHESRSKSQRNDLRFINLVVFIVDCFAFIVLMAIFRWTGAECHLSALSYQHILFWDCLNISWAWAELCRRGHQKVSAFSVCARIWYRCDNSI